MKRDEVGNETITSSRQRGKLLRQARHSYSLLDGSYNMESSKYGAVISPRWIYSACYDGH